MHEFRIQVLPNDDIMPRWFTHDSRNEAFDAARKYVGRHVDFHHVQVLDHNGNCVWDVLTEPEPAGPSPSVRLARWLDGHLERRVRIYGAESGDGLWCVVLLDENGESVPAEAGTRASALSAALDQAEGVRDAGH